jgi:nickel/cobalt transporter (NicO) family protein
MPLLFLISAAALVAILHSILPDHWIPLAIIARTQRWNLLRVGWVTLLASLGHVIASLVLGGIIAAVGLQFQHEIDTQQGHVIGIVLMLTGMAFLVWGLVNGRNHEHGAGHSHTHGFGHLHTHDDEHRHQHGADHSHTHSVGQPHTHDSNHGHAHERSYELEQSQNKKQPLLKWLATIAVPFGVAASPDLTILPVALAASTIGIIAVVSVLSVFAVVTIVTFIGLTLMATLIGYQIKGDWLEKHAMTITSLVLIAIGLAAFISY